jgi:type I pantothenate kinase
VGECPQCQKRRDRPGLEGLEQAKTEALRVWDEIDHPNLKENIKPTKDRARLILEKGHDLSVQSVRLRKM